MKITGRSARAGLCGTFLAALGALPAPAFAKDLPPTPEGAQKLSALFATYLGKPAAGAASPVAVTIDGAHYVVALDVAALMAPLNAAGFSMDPATLTTALIEQDDGAWHVVQDSLPPLSFHLKDSVVAYNVTAYKLDELFDPALAVFKSGQRSFDKIVAQVHAPQVDETITVGAAHVTQTGVAAANGAASVAAHEEIADFSGNVSTASGEIKDGADAKRPPVSFQVGATAADVGMDGAPMRKAFDLWAFAVAHPTRPEIAADEPKFKSLLRAMLPIDFKLTEKASTKQIAVETPQGHFGMTSAKLNFAAAAVPGAKGSAEYELAMDGLSLPTGLLPPAMSDLVPTAFNIDIRTSGFDSNAGAEEAINDMHFSGDGPIISDNDRAQILAKIKGSGPIVVEVLPSHFIAPQVDLTVEGQVHLEGVRPSGVMKVRVRNFDKTIAALKAIGPAASPQLLGGLALAKTLGKSESDGSLTWVAEYGVDGSVKVNGMPLGKAP